MPAATTITEADILTELVAPDQPGIQPEFARAILDVHFTDKANKQIRRRLDEADGFKWRYHQRMNTALQNMVGEMLEPVFHSR